MYDIMLKNRVIINLKNPVDDIISIFALPHTSGKNKLGKKHPNT